MKTLCVLSVLLVMASAGFAQKHKTRLLPGQKIVKSSHVYVQRGSGMQKKHKN